MDILYSHLSNNEIIEFTGQEISSTVNRVNDGNVVYTSTGFRNYQMLICKGWVVSISNLICILIRSNQVMLQTSLKKPLKYFTVTSSYAF